MPFFEAIRLSMAAMAALLIVAAIDVFVLGHSEGAIGPPFINWVFDALLFVPIILVIGFGYWIPAFARRARYPAAPESRHLHMAGASAGFAVCLWALLSPTTEKLAVTVLAIAVVAFSAGFIAGLIIPGYAKGVHGAA